MLIPLKHWGIPLTNSRSAIKFGRCSHIGPPGPPRSVGLLTELWDDVARCLRPPWLGPMEWRRRRDYFPDGVGYLRRLPFLKFHQEMGSEPTNTGWLRYTGDMCYWDITYITNKYESDPIEQLNIWSSHRCVDSHNNQTACFFSWDLIHTISTLLTMISVWQSIMGVSFIETLGMSEWK